MKKLIFFFLVSFQVCGAQENKIQDTIYANEFYNTNLFFPDPVKQGVVGGANFTFSYNEVEAQPFGLLKATAGQDSNLLVVTDEGSLYSYILSYRKKLPKLNYFINRQESIGGELPLQENEVQEKGLDSSDKGAKRVDSPERETFHIRKAAQYNLNLKPKKVSRKRKGGIELAIQGINYYEDEVLVVLELENNSGISLEVDYLRLFLIKGNNKRSSSYQKIQQQEVWSYNRPKVLYHGQRLRFVLAFSKFVPGRHEKVLLELREQHGNRLLRIKMDPKVFIDIDN